MTQVDHRLNNKISSKFAFLINVTENMSKLTSWRDLYEFRFDYVIILKELYNFYELGIKSDLSPWVESYNKNNK